MCTTINPISRQVSPLGTWLAAGAHGCCRSAFVGTQKVVDKSCMSKGVRSANHFRVAGVLPVDRGRERSAKTQNDNHTCRFAAGSALTLVTRNHLESAATQHRSLASGIQ